MRGLLLLLAALLLRDRPMTPPRRHGRAWTGFLHLLARRYQDYERLVLKAARRRWRKRAIDVDGQRSAQGTGWALHWSTVGRNKLHDPRGHISKATRIDHLSDDQIERLRGPRGQHTRRLSYILAACDARSVRAEVEPKVTFGAAYVERLAARPYVQRLRKRGLLQVKTLASMSAPNGGTTRLRPWHDAGFVTILSFSTWTARTTRAHKGVSKRLAWPVVDYVRGRPRWTA